MFGSLGRSGCRNPGIAEAPVTPASPPRNSRLFSIPLLLLLPVDLQSKLNFARIIGRVAGRSNLPETGGVVVIQRGWVGEVRGVGYVENFRAEFGVQPLGKVE